MLLSKVLAQEKMKNAPTACFDRSLYNFRFFIRAHEIPCQQSVSSAREKSDLTIRGSENPFSDKRGQKKTHGEHEDKDGNIRNSEILVLSSLERGIAGKTQ